MSQDTQLSSSMQNLLASDISRDEMFAQVSGQESPRKKRSKGKFGKIQQKRKQIMSRIMPSSRAPDVPEGFTLSAPTGFQQKGHIDFDPETGEFTVRFFLFFLFFFFFYGCINTSVFFSIRDYQKNGRLC